MKYFLDSAKIEEIRYAYENWGIDGVTSNPKHIQKSGKSFHAVIQEFSGFIAEIAQKSPEFTISVEIDPHLDHAEAMIAEAKKIASICDRFVIKIPSTEQGFIAAKKLTETGVKVNLTLVFSASQALQAGRLGCYYVSPFIGWQESSGVDTADFLTRIVQIYANFEFETEIIVAAVRNGKQITDAALLGADIVTAGFEVYKESFEHPFTSKGLQIFQNSWDQTKMD